MNESVILIGAGGHAKVLVDVLLLKSINILGVTDKSKKSEFCGLPIIGNDDVILTYDPKTIYLVNGVGSIGDNAVRKEIHTYFTEKGYRFLTLVHPTAIIANDSVIEEGVQVMAGAIIQPGSKIGEGTIINTRATIDHDCHIGKHVHIAPGVTLSGNVEVEDDVHIGTGATVIQGIHIAKSSLIGAGAVVSNHVLKNTKVVGVPARELK